MNGAKWCLIGILSTAVLLSVASATTTESRGYELSPALEAAFEKSEYFLGKAVLDDGDESMDSPLARNMKYGVELRTNMRKSTTTRSTRVVEDFGNPRRNKIPNDASTYVHTWVGAKMKLVKLEQQLSRFPEIENVKGKKAAHPASAEQIELLGRIRTLQNAMANAEQALRGTPVNLDNIYEKKLADRNIAMRNLELKSEFEKDSREIREQLSDPELPREARRPLADKLMLMRMQWGEKSDQVRIQNGRSPRGNPKVFRDF